ncbi:MAG: hypothetical protein WA990_03765 [Rubrobacteraceae bacterium]
MGKGSTKFILGAAAGAAGGFVIGSVVSNPTSRSASNAALKGVGISIRFLGRTAVDATRGLGVVLESGYTRLRGREAYVENEIKQLQEQISRLEQRME